MGEIIWYMSFFDWLVLLSIILPRFIHAAAKGKISIFKKKKDFNLFMAEYFIIYICIHTYTHTYINIYIIECHAAIKGGDCGICNNLDAWNPKKKINKQKKPESGLYIQRTNWWLPEVRKWRVGQPRWRWMEDTGFQLME